MDCRITVAHHLDPTWSAWFDGLTIANLENGTAVMTGRVIDQAALHGVLAKIRDLGLPLTEVHCDYFNDMSGTANIPRLCSNA
jgi:hypothetical protein